ncbi:NAD-dependent epimerase/dehydratase family protein [Allostreptomyces psammosilenae]|uniref:Nucleoside-diphosphate-sugar epimerase n=1 Tax=Allostreptomyces psammosilenae TaxID=1892865 RepID=A0A853A2U1_9ACTN|nr:NAD-dependent epimerase/dehydratase family protein [Allostreptomyces psammosilenae]NYI07194.1 nucleoside-diphosphate-sugar epimerase [Allostreptomyces psammosilenae]
MTNSERDDSILVLGGSGFVGRAVAVAAADRGWPVTVFNRGRSTMPGARLPESVEVVHGDRTAPGALEELAGRRWRAVIDTWSTAPTAVRDAARALEPHADRYVYVSSCSVYEFPPPTPTDESAPVVAGSPDDADGDHYPTAKAGAELAALSAFGPERTVLARAGLIIGPWENVGRLPWWLARIARGGDVLAPGPRGSALQYVDVRDLAAWLLDAAVTDSLRGAYNVVSETGHATMEELLDACVEATGSGARLRWAEPERVLAAGVEPWNELPIWVPEGHEYRFVYEVDTTRARAAGLRCRPVAETVADTWEWLRAAGGSLPPHPRRRGRDGTTPPPIGLTPEREAALLAALDD